MKKELTLGEPQAGQHPAHAGDPLGVSFTFSFTKGRGTALQGAQIHVPLDDRRGPETSRGARLLLDQIFGPGRSLAGSSAGPTAGRAAGPRGPEISERARRTRKTRPWNSSAPAAGVESSFKTWVSQLFKEPALTRPTRKGQQAVHTVEQGGLGESPAVGCPFGAAASTASSSRVRLGEEDREDF